MPVLDSLEQEICRRLSALGKTLATAESCSGGLIAHRITNVAGASAIFAGGMVAYSNTVKENLLGVSAVTLTSFGAVSAETAREMVLGAQRCFGVDYAIAVTGIAGPGGGTKEKPVGLVYIAVAGPQGAMVKRHEFNGAREVIKQQTADAALAMIWEWLE